MRTSRTNRHALAALLTTAAVLAPSATAGAQPYEVQPGDTLSSIAQRHGVSVSDIAAANGLQQNPHLLQAGEVLAIPELSGDLATDAAGFVDLDYDVEAGDTLWGLAQRYGTTVDHLAATNGLEDPDLVRVGEVLTITPAGERQALGAPSDTDSTTAPADAAVETTEPAAEPAPAPTTPPGPAAEGSYLVQRGDTYWGIAMAHGTTVTALLQANDLSVEDLIREGQQLRLPIATPGTAVEAAPQVAPAPAPVPSSGLPAALLADPDKLALQPVFDRWADANGVPRDLLKAITWFESGWDNTVRSSAGAVGIGQILPVTGDFVANQLIGVPLDPTMAEDNIRLSARYLRYLIEQTGDQRSAVAAYYQGLTAVRVHGVFASSEAYVEGVLGMRSRFQ